MSPKHVPSRLQPRDVRASRNRDLLKKSERLVHLWTQYKRFFVWALLMFLTGFTIPHAAAAPISIAVFNFELEDFSAAPSGSKPNETAYLVQSTNEAKRWIVKSERYNLVETAGRVLQPEGDKGLKDCSGCEAAIAAKLGAEQSLLGVIKKISMTEYTVTMSVRDTATGKVVATYFTNLRIGANYSWSRGVAWLMKNRMMADKGTP